MDWRVVAMNSDDESSCDSLFSHNEIEKITAGQELRSLAGSSICEDDSVASGAMSSDDDDDFDENERFQIECMPIYTFLRTLSLELHLSPFELTTFVQELASERSSLALDPYNRNTRCELLNEIHMQLILIGLTTALGASVHSWWQVPWTMLDRNNWTEFLQPYFEMWVDHEDTIIKSMASEIVSSLSIMQENGQSYIKFPKYLKLKLIQGLIKVLLVSEIISFVMEERESRGKLDDPFPLYQKGDDGYPDVCLVCCEGGDLVCCEFCPGSYHKQCIVESNPAVFEGIWQCSECLIPDPLRGRGRLVWYPCDFGQIAIIGESVIFKRYGKSSLEDYWLLNYSEIMYIITPTLFEYIPWKHFLCHVANSTKNGKFQLSETNDFPMRNRFLSLVSSNHLVERNRVENNAGLYGDHPENFDETDSNDSDSSESEFLGYRTDSSLESQENEEENKVLKRRGSMGKRESSKSHRQEIAKVKGKRGRKNKFELAATTGDLEEFKESKYLKIDDMIKLSGNFHIANLQRLIPTRDKLYERYLNRYRDAKMPNTFPDLRSQLIKSRLESRSIKSSLETLYHAIGTFNSEMLSLYFPLRCDMWIIELLNATTLRQCKMLLLKLISRTDPKAFRFNWFSSTLDCEIDCLGRLRTLKLPDDKRKASIKKMVPVRTYRFTRLRSIFEIMYAGTSAFSNDSHQKSAPIHHKTKHYFTEQNVKEDVENDTSNEDQNPGDEINEKKSDLEETSVDGIEILKRNFESSNFNTGKRFTPLSRRCMVPKQLLRRLSRNGGLALLPIVAYCDDMNTFASPPFNWYWKYRVKTSSSYESLALQIRFVEEALVERIQLRIAPKSVHDNNCSEFVDLVLDPTANGFSVPVQLNSVKEPMISEIRWFSLITNHPINKTLYLNYLSDIMNDSVLGFIVNQTQTHLPVIEYNIISGDEATHGSRKFYHNIPISYISSYNMRIWIQSVLDDANFMTKTADYQRMYKFCNTIYSLLLQSGYCDDDDMMIHKEVQVAILSERECAKNDLHNILAMLGDSIPLQNKCLDGLVNSVLNKSILAVSELVKFDNLSNVSIATSQENEIPQKNRKNGKTEQGAHSLDTIDEKLIPFAIFEQMKYLRHTFDSSESNRQKKKTYVVPVNETNLYRKRVLTAKEKVDRRHCDIFKPTETSWYLPQVGDELMYFVGGHREYLTQYSDSGSKIERVGLTKKYNAESGVACKILSIDYEFPVSPLADDRGIHLVLLLGVCPGQKNIPVKSFVVVYRPRHSKAEFLVIREVIERCLYSNWTPCMPFRMTYAGGDVYEGKVVSIRRDEHGLSCWAGASVTWENLGEDTLNEWELEKIPLTIKLTNLNQKSKNNRRSISAVVIENSDGVETSSPCDLYNDCLQRRRENINKKLLIVVDKFLDNSEFEAFRDYVDGKFIIEGISTFLVKINLILYQMVSPRITLVSFPYVCT